MHGMVCSGTLVQPRGHQLREDLGGRQRQRPILRSRYDHTVLGTEIGPFTNNPG